MSFMEIMVGAATTLGAAVVGVWGLSVANKHQKGTREDRLIDQLQEELNGLKADQKQSKIDHAADFKELKKRVLQSELRDQTYIPFILKQQHHIEQGLGPPAPALPTLVKEFLAEMG